jgi:ABC-type dipeptide/oligopeptide/nickel transport system ATPase component
MEEARGAAVENKPLLEVKNLKTWFYTPDGIVKAVNGVSYTLNEGEALGLVGESGCGKSVSAMSLMRLIPTPPGRIVGRSAVRRQRPAEVERRGHPAHSRQ